jgi:hypothetical protein
VTFSKLKRYIEQQGGYDLEQLGNDVSLSFVPVFPEAIEKGRDDASPPRVILHGKINRQELTFYSVEIEENHTLRTKDFETAELTYRSWLEFIEENY